MRDAAMNRIAVLEYANTTMSGPATGPNDALLVDGPSGKMFVPIVVPLTDFMPVPQLRPGQ